MNNNNVDFVKEEKMITKQELLELATEHTPHCVSIFIPTHRAGEETLKGKDALNLKNQLREVKAKLEGLGMRVDSIDAYVKPIQDLVDNGEFWRHQSDGLAIFLSENLFQSYVVPVSFEEFNYISNEFYIKPIIPILNGDGLFYLLTLKKDEVKFYEGTRHSVTEIMIDDIVPSRLEDRVGYDYEQKGLQFRTQQGNRGQGSFHGHQDLDTNEKIELTQYFRAVDKGLMKILNDDQASPLVVCSLDFYFPLYKEVSSYKNLFPQHLSGNPGDKDSIDLQEEAWELLEPYFAKARQEKLDNFSEFFGTGKASATLEEIFPAAYEGRVDTLFLENRSDVFGVYNPTTGELRTHDVHQFPNVSLTNLLATMVLKTGGTVYLLEKQKMPSNSSSVNALFRY